MTGQEIQWIALKAVESLESKNGKGELITSQQLKHYVKYYTKLYLDAKTHVKTTAQEKTAVSQDHSNDEPLPGNPFKI